MCLVAQPPVLGGDCQYLVAFSGERQAVDYGGALGEGKHTKAESERELDASTNCSDRAEELLCSCWQNAAQLRNAAEYL